MDPRLHQRMHNLPTKQEPYAQTKDPLIQNPIRPRSQTLFTHCYGPNHWPTQQQGLRRYPHYRRPQMFLRCNISSLHDHDHQTPNCQTLSQSSLLMVWTSQTNYQRQRSPIHIPLWSHTHKGTRDTTEPIHSISPSDRRFIGTKEPMD